MSTPTSSDVVIYLHPLPEYVTGVQKLVVSSSGQPATFSHLATLVNTVLSRMEKHCLDWNLADSPVIYGRLERPNGEIDQVFLSEDRHLQEFLTRPLRTPSISFCKERMILPNPLYLPSSMSTPTRLQVCLYLHHLPDHALGVSKVVVSPFELPVTFLHLATLLLAKLSTVKKRISWNLADSPHIYGHSERPNVEIGKISLLNDQDLQAFLSRPLETHRISFCKLPPTPSSPLEAPSSSTAQATTSGTAAGPASVNAPLSVSKPLARKRGLSKSDEDVANHKRGSQESWRILSVGHPDDADWGQKSMRLKVDFTQDNFMVPSRTLVVDRSSFVQAIENPDLRKASEDRMVITHFDVDSLDHVSGLTSIFNNINGAKRHDETFGEMLISKIPDILHSQYLILEMNLAPLASHLTQPSDLLQRLSALVVATLAGFCMNYESRLPFTWESIYRPDRPLYDVIRDFMTAFDRCNALDEILLILKRYDHPINAAFLNSRCNQTVFNEHAVIELLCTYFFDPISRAKDAGIIKRIICFGRSNAARLALASRFRLYDVTSHPSISRLMYATETELRESMKFLYADIPPELLATRANEAELWIAGQSDRSGREPTGAHYVEWGLMYKILSRVFHQRQEPERSLIDTVDNLPHDCFTFLELQLFGIAIAQTPHEFLLERLPPLIEPVFEDRTEVWDCPCPNVLFRYTDVLALPASNNVVVTRLNLSPLDSQVAIFKLFYEAGLLTLAMNDLDQTTSNDVYLRLPNLRAKNLVMSIVETYARYDYTTQGYAGTEWLKSSVLNFMRDRDVRVLKTFKEATLQNTVVAMLSMGGAAVGRIPREAVLDELRLYDKRYIDRFCDLFLPTLRVVIELKNINILDLFKGIYGRLPTNDDELDLFLNKYLFEVDIPSDADFDDDSKAVIAPAGFKKFGDSLTWADLWYEIKKEDGTTVFQSVDTCFRLGIGQLRGYQGNIAVGRFPVWRRSKITTIKAPTQMLKATLLMLLAGRLVVTKDLEDIPTDYEFRVEPK
ncbi:hypothetical protein BDZ89DRAFT_1058584 [Hymenopellis radicata]|nr:hypothetical protein BDZ89DRAFT_1058584 [Hymenopellis radicata]